MKYLRENLLRFHPSIFHVSAVKVREVVEGKEDGRDITEAVGGASTKEVDLSDLSSLNCVHDEEEISRSLLKLQEPDHQLKQRSHHSRLQSQQTLLQYDQG